MTRVRLRRFALIAAAVLILLPLGIIVPRDLHGLALVVRAANLGGLARRLADLDVVPIRESLVRVPLRDGSMRARVYAPLGPSRHTVLLVSGLHAAGIDEPRLITLSRRFAEANVTVVTPEISELSRFEITPRLTDHIEDAAVWLATGSGLAPDGRIGLIGISFSGGLAIVAAGRPALRDHLRYVFSFGGHDDLRRVLQFVSSGNATGVLPHDYGVAVVLLAVADRLVPPDQARPLRDGVERFLWASYLDTIDKARAEREFEAARDIARRLPEPAAMLLRYVNARDVVRLRPLLEPHVAAYVDAPALSPARSPAPQAPVFLLHGRDDNVIPVEESRLLADRLRHTVPVRLLVTDLITHAEADQPAHPIDIMRLAAFWGDVMAQE